jgi:UDP-N-acetylglucosamine--N-acetylmuramyl-(pentapeptide) pyrophosphoryl-undecaprenol N-acetylglucosamine transferase
MIRRIAFAVGDTAGHVMPALAIGEAYEQLGVPVEIRLFAASGGPASRLAREAGRPLDLVPASALARVGPAARMAALARVARGIPVARHQLRQAGTRLVIGTGGYASGAVVLAARSLGVVASLVEPNSSPGLANRLLRPWVERAYVSSESCVRFFGSQRALLTGTPVRSSIAERLGRPRVPAPDGPVHVLVTGASRGEQFLVSEMPALLGAVRQAIARPLMVRHQCGAADGPQLEEQYRRAGVTASAVPFVDDMFKEYERTHFVISRAGAGTLAELALAALPALIVPLADAAADHQSANADDYASGGAALWRRERDWSRDAVARQVADVLGSPERWAEMSAAAHRKARPRAAMDVVDDCERLMEGRW